MEPLMYIAAFIVGILAGKVFNSNRDTRLIRENDILREMLETQERQFKETFDWISDQMMHRDAMNVALGNMREVATRFEDGAISADEAHLQYEMLRAEGQMHFDALDEKLRDWYDDQVTTRGMERIFRNDNRES